MSLFYTHRTASATMMSPDNPRINKPHVITSVVADTSPSSGVAVSVINSDFATPQVAIFDEVPDEDYRAPDLQMTARTLLENIDRRILLDREDSDSAYIQALTLKLEYLTKLVTAGVLACVGDDADRHRYSQEHALVRADSIGNWVQTLNNVLSGPTAQFFLPGSRDVVKNLTERVGLGDWRNSTVTTGECC